MNWENKKNNITGSYLEAIWTKILPSNICAFPSVFIELTCKLNSAFAGRQKEGLFAAIMKYLIMFHKLYIQ